MSTIKQEPLTKKQYLQLSAYEKLIAEGLYHMPEEIFEEIGLSVNQYPSDFEFIKELAKQPIDVLEDIGLFED